MVCLNNRKTADFGQIKISCLKSNFMKKKAAENGSNNKPSKKTSKETASVRKSEKKNFLVVGIGASAGGVKALKDFFQVVRKDSGMAYVVILHLSPDYESKLAEVLQATSQIPVRQVKNQRVEVKPNCVYVISPNKSLTIKDGFLSTSPIKNYEQRRAPVDI